MTNYSELNLISKTYFLNTNYEISILSNASSLLNEYLEDVSWVGFYLLKDNKLILGPFQGKIACNEIEIGKGVCGTCAKDLSAQVVPNVHLFKGHIACDSRSNSEIVLPIMIKDKLYGVLDIDSTSYSRFNELDQKELEIFIESLSKALIKFL